MKNRKIKWSKMIVIFIVSDAMATKLFMRVDRFLPTYSIEFNSAITIKKYIFCV